MNRMCHCNKPGCYPCKLYNEDPRYQGAVSSFVSAMATELAWRAKGNPAPTVEEKERRRAECDKCDRRDATNDSCTLCGCYLEAGLIPPRPLGKLDCSTQSCPIGRWGTVGGYTQPCNCGGK